MNKGIMGDLVFSKFLDDNRYQSAIILFFCLVITLVSCNSKATEEDGNLGKRQYLREPNMVDVMVVQYTDFHRELVSNGMLRAERKSVLKCRISEELVKLNYRNGDSVEKGAVIAELNSADQSARIKRAITGIKKAELNLMDFLLGHGNLELKDTAFASPEVLQNGKIRSGYLEAQHELQAAQEEYASCFLRAPFSGKVANLDFKTHEWVNTGEEFCTLIDDQVFEVVFSVLETELRDISIGKTARIEPFALDETYRGMITEINPQVDENGLIQVKAEIRNTGRLMEGMNVKIYIETIVPKQLVVPKEAVVLRQNQEVLFRIVNGKAYWTYVKTRFENSASFSVMANPEKGAQLNPGDTVIISGNLNLAHESEVEVRE